MSHTDERLSHFGFMRLAFELRTGRHFASAIMVEFKLCSTDLPAKQRKPVSEAVRVFYNKLVGDLGSEAGDKQRKEKIRRWTEFAKSMKASLDTNLGPHWHVLVGTSLGFACKKRHATMGVWRAGTVMIVIWQSPWIEGPATAPDVSEESAVANDPTEVANADVAESRREVVLKVVEPPKVAADSGEETAVSVLRTALGTLPEDVTADTQKLAQALRAKLMTELGPIWHVVVGTEFAAKVAEDRRNYLVVTFGRLRIVCFQHEQYQGGSRIDWEKLFKALPYLLIVIACFGYMAMQGVCGDEPRANQKWAWWLRQNFCSSDWESQIGYVAAAALVLSFVARKGPAFFAGSGKAKLA